MSSPSPSNSSAASLRRQSTLERRQSKFSKSTSSLPKYDRSQSVASSTTSPEEQTAAGRRASTMRRQSSMQGRSTKRNSVMNKRNSVMSKRNSVLSKTGGFNADSEQPDRRMSTMRRMDPKQAAKLKRQEEKRRKMEEEAKRKREEEERWQAILAEEQRPKSIDDFPEDRDPVSIENWTPRTRYAFHRTGLTPKDLRLPCYADVVSKNEYKNLPHSVKVTKGPSIIEAALAALHKKRTTAINELVRWRDSAPESVVLKAEEEHKPQPNTDENNLHNTSADLSSQMHQIKESTADDDFDDFEDSARSEYDDSDNIILNRHRSQIGDLPEHIVRSPTRRVDHHVARNKHKMRQHLAMELGKVLVQEKRVHLEKTTVERSHSIEAKMEQRRQELTRKVQSTRRKINHIQRITKEHQKQMHLKFEAEEQIRLEKKRQLEIEQYQEMLRRREQAEAKRQANYRRMQEVERAKKDAVLSKVRSVEERLAEKAKEEDLEFHMKRFLSNISQEEAAARRAMKEQQVKNKAQAALDAIAARERRLAEQKQREEEIAMKTMKLARPEFELQTPLQRLVNYIKQRGTMNVEPRKLRAKAKSLGIVDVDVCEILEQMKEHHKFG